MTDGDAWFQHQFGTENPRVGGSTPSLATSNLLVLPGNLYSAELRKIIGRQQRPVTANGMAPGILPAWR
jgi:hypothetical protein